MLARSLQPELMDVISQGDLEYHSAVLEFDKVNRLTGNYYLLAKYLKPFVFGKKFVKILDFGCGAGHTARFLSDHLKQVGVNSHIFGFDTSVLALDTARKMSTTYSNISFVSNSLDLSTEGDFDVVIMSQVLHHLSFHEAVDVLKDLYRHCSGGIIISDFFRSNVAYWFVRLFFPFITKNRLHRNDGPHSILRSYSRAEIIQIFHQAGVVDFTIHRWWPRVIVIAKK